MIGWEDISKVIVAMVPLYVALILGYGAIKWWKLFKSDHCDVVNRLFCYFINPFFTFEFTTHSDPFAWNFRFIGADVISKVLIAVVITLWAVFSSKGNYRWSITSYSLTLSNTLFIGVPLLRAMYGTQAVDLVVLSFILQSLLWFIILLFVLEIHRSKVEGEEAKDLEGNKEAGQATRPSFWSLMKTVWLKLAVNPNSYACILGIVWALIANRWDKQMPSVVEKSVLIMSNAGSGIAMFSMGMFMAVQQKVIACGPKLTILGMLLKFIAVPLAMAIGALMMGLRGDVLRIVIIQATLPQSITSFVYAKECDLHADVISTAVIFGTVVSLPIMIGYFAALGAVH